MSTNFRTGFPKVRTALFQLDAFTNRRFAGNPAAVMPMDRFPGDTLLQAVAAENNLSETAFLLGHGDEYQIRWFTPNTEVPLCGHATLASAAVVMEQLEPGRRRGGEIACRCVDDRVELEGCVAFYLEGEVEI